MIYGYARVSTNGQAIDGNSLEAQENTLRTNGAVEIYREQYTGATMERPELQKILQKIKKGDTLIVTKLDRISRSVTQGIELVDSLNERGVTLNVLNMGVMNNSTTGKLIRNVMFAFAEFERDIIKDRTSEGRAIARQNPNYKEGRPATPYDEKKLEHYKELVASGKISVTQACKEMGMQRSKWYRV